VADWHRFWGVGCTGFGPAALAGIWRLVISWRFGEWTLYTFWRRY
jgi:hypothetical protein